MSPPARASRPRRRRDRQPLHTRAAISNPIAPRRHTHATGHVPAPNAPRGSNIPPRPEPAASHAHSRRAHTSPADERPSGRQKLQYGRAGKTVTCSLCARGVQPTGRTPPSPSGSGPTGYQGQITWHVYSPLPTGPAAPSSSRRRCSSARHRRVGPPLPAELPCGGELLRNASIPGVCHGTQNTIGRDALRDALASRRFHNRCNRCNE